MAIRFNGASYIKCTASLPSNTAFTACCWGVRDVQPAIYNTVLSVQDDPITSSYAVLSWSPSANVLKFYHRSGDSGAFTTPPTLGAWAFYAVTGGVNSKGYVGNPGEALQSLTGDSLTQPIGAIVCGDDPNSGDYLDGRVAAVKVWSAELTSDELEKERWSFLPYRWANLHSFFPMTQNTLADNYLDFSGNGRNFAVTGTGTATGDGPPISWGARRSLILNPAAAAATYAPPFPLRTQTNFMPHLIGR